MGSKTFKPQVTSWSTWGPEIVSEQGSLPLNAPLYTIQTSPRIQRMGELRVRPQHTNTMRETRAILVINPNSTESMTNALKPLVDRLQFQDV
jgi:hypothetical protein